MYKCTSCSISLYTDVITIYNKYSYMLNVNIPMYSYCFEDATLYNIKVFALQIFVSLNNRGFCCKLD